MRLYLILLFSRLQTHPNLSCSASRVRKTLSDFLHKTPKVIDDKLMNVARPLIPFIEALSVKIAFLLDVNRAIHSSTYNSLIAAAVGGFAEAAAAAK